MDRARRASDSHASEKMSCGGLLPSSVMEAVAPLTAAYIAYAFGLTSIFVVALVVYVVSLAVLKLGVKI